MDATITYSIPSGNFVETATTTNMYNLENTRVWIPRRGIVGWFLRIINSKHYWKEIDCENITLIYN